MVHGVCGKHNRRDLFLCAPWKNGRYGCIEFIGKRNSDSNRIGLLCIVTSPVDRLPDDPIVEDRCLTVGEYRKTVALKRTNSSHRLLFENENMEKWVETLFLRGRRHRRGCCVSCLALHIKKSLSVVEWKSGKAKASLLPHTVP